MQKYLCEQGFVEFESLTLTRQTLYDDTGAIWLDVNNQNIYLSRCATFYFEPAEIAYEKVFTIANSHADEKIMTNRHLVEYMHLKVEMCWCDLDKLIELAGKVYYEAAKRTADICKEQFDIIVDAEILNKKLSRLNPANHIHIIYDEAVELLHSERAVRYLLDVDHVKFTKPFAVVKGTKINH